MPPVPTPVLSTPDLLLKPVRIEHAPALQRHFARWEIIRNLSTAVPWPYPSHGMQAFIAEDLLPRVRRGAAHAWAICPKGDAEPIGLLEWRCDAGPTDDHRGFWLAEAWQGRGLMTQAIVAFQDWIFCTLNHPQLVLHSAVANPASRRVKEKTGARIVDVVSLSHHGGNHETYRWVITRTDWLQHPLCQGNPIAHIPRSDRKN